MDHTPETFGSHRFPRTIDNSLQGLTCASICREQSGVWGITKNTGECGSSRTALYGMWGVVGRHMIL